MTATLTSLETRIKTYLSDTTSLVFSTGLVDEGMRLALGQYNLVMVSSCTINGLDGAGATTLPANAESLIVLGAGGYACQSRLVKRSESFNLAQKMDTDLLTFGKMLVAEFNASLSILKTYADNITATLDPSSIAGRLAAEAAALAANTAHITAETTGQTAATAKLTAETAAITADTAAKAAATAALAAALAAEAARLALLRGAAVPPYPDAATTPPATGWRSDDYDIDD